MRESHHAMLRASDGFVPAEDRWDRMLRLAARRQRNRRVGSALLAIAIFAGTDIALLRAFRPASLHSTPGGQVVVPGGSGASFEPRPHTSDGVTGRESDDLGSWSVAGGTHVGDTPRGTGPDGRIWTASTRPAPGSGPSHESSSEGTNGSGSGPTGSTPPSNGTSGGSGGNGSDGDGSGGSGGSSGGSPPPPPDPTPQPCPPTATGIGGAPPPMGPAPLGNGRVCVPPEPAPAPPPPTDQTGHDGPLLSLPLTRSWDSLPGRGR